MNQAQTIAYQQRLDPDAMAATIQSMTGISATVNAPITAVITINSVDGPMWLCIAISLHTDKEKEYLMDLCIQYLEGVGQKGKSEWIFVPPVMVLKRPFTETECTL